MSRSFQDLAVLIGRYLWPSLCSPRWSLVPSIASQTSSERHDPIGHAPRLKMQMKLYERELVLHGLVSVMAFFAERL